jgi:beta-N-acetylhexosaminidase
MSPVRPQRAGRASLTRLADGVLIPPFPGTTAPDWLLAALERGLAGVTLFGPNVAGTGQLATLTERLRGATDHPVIAIDEEGGDVTRIAHLTGSPYPGNAALGAADDTDLTMRVYQAIGADLTAVGINVDLAPSVDVNTSDDNPVIGTRAFGADTEMVARHAAAAVTGLQRIGVAACAKHFPGHGSTREDTHHELATVTGGIDALWERDLPPFQAAIAAGVKGVMTGHLRVLELTGDLPATLSRAALTGLLRDQLGFRGVIVSDALEMRAIRAGASGRSIPAAAVAAVAAGADLLCFGRDTGEQTYRAVRAALADAVRTGELQAARLEEAAARVGELRLWLASAAAGPVGPPTQAGSAADGSGPSGSGVSPDSAVPSRAAAAGAAVGLAAARRAVRISGMHGQLMRPFVVQMEPPVNIAAGTVPWGLGPWLPERDLLRVAQQAGATAADTAATAIGQAAGRSLVVVVRDAHRDPAARAVVSAVLAARPDTTVVEMGLPMWRPEAGTYLATYGAGYANCQAAAEILGLDRGGGPPREHDG